MTAFTSDVAHLATPGLVSVEAHGTTLIVRLTRPAKRNALNDPTIHALDKAVGGLPKNFRAIVIEGEGDHFSAGLDLSELTERNVLEGVEHSLSWYHVFERLQFGRVPIVSVLKGAVIGGGLELALTTHIRVAETSAYYALPEGQRGIYTGGGASVRLTRVIGSDRMMDMMLTGRTYSAAEGNQMGISQYLVEPGKGLEKALELAEKIAKNATVTSFALLQVLPRIAEMDRPAGHVAEALMAGIAQGEPDAKARLRAFLDGKAAKVKPTG